MQSVRLFLDLWSHKISPPAAHALYEALSKKVSLTKKFCWSFVFFREVKVVTTIRHTVYIGKYKSTRVNIYGININKARNA